jgi:osmoprotectant transport system substrate-binding protein
MVRRSVLVVVAVAVAAACVATPEPAVSPTADGPVVRIGTGPEAESLLITDVVAGLLTAEGFRPQVVPLASGRAARQALEVGDVDVVPGYTGQAWLEVLGRANPPGDPASSFARVSASDQADGIRWLRPRFALESGIDGPPANATFGLFVRGIPSADADLRTITQLATRLANQPDARVCIDEEFAARPDGWEAVARAYSIANPVTPADPEVAVASVAAGECLVGLSTTTDGLAWHTGLQLLTDPQQVFPAFVVSVQVREEFLAAEPGLETALQPLVDQLSTRLLGTWNGQVVGGRPREIVVAEAVATLRDDAG